MKYSIQILNGQDVTWQPLLDKVYQYYKIGIIECDEANITIHTDDLEKAISFCKLIQIHLENDPKATEYFIGVTEDHYRFNHGYLDEDNQNTLEDNGETHG